MKRLAFAVFLTFVTLSAVAQRPFEGFFTNSNWNIKMQLNLYADSIDVPGLELEQCYGYLKGDINGMWVILKVSELKDGNKAIVRAVSERGGDAQDIEFRKEDNGDLILDLKGDTELRGVVAGKRVKLPKNLRLERMKND